MKINSNYGKHKGKPHSKIKINLSSEQNSLCSNTKPYTDTIFPIYQHCDTSATCSGTYWGASRYEVQSRVHFVIKPPTSNTEKSSRACFTLGLIKEVEVIANCSWRTGVAGKMRAGWPLWAHEPNKTQQATWGKRFDATGRQILCPPNVSGRKLQLGKKLKHLVLQLSEILLTADNTDWEENTVNGLVLLNILHQQNGGYSARLCCS